MYEKTNYLCFLVQRYPEILNEENPFNESLCFFSQIYKV